MADKSKFGIWGKNPNQEVVHVGRPEYVAGQPADSAAEWNDGQNRGTVRTGRAAWAKERKYWGPWGKSSSSSSSSM